MEGTLRALQLNIFDILSYFLPGFVLLSGVLSITTQSGISLIQNNILYTVIFSYLLGSIIHTFSNIPQDLLWKYYHKFKETDEKGHGIKVPKTVNGKFCKFIRYKLLDFEQKGYIAESAKKKLIKFSLEHGEFSDLDLFKLKETAFIANTEISGYFEYLNYQKVFCSSISLVFLIFTIFFPCFEIFRNINNSTINITTSIDLKSFSIIFSFFSIILFFIFMRRSIFFKEYKDSIMNSNIILYFNNPKSGNN